MIFYGNEPFGRNAVLGVALPYTISIDAAAVFDHDGCSLSDINDRSGQNAALIIETRIHADAKSVCRSFLLAGWQTVPCVLIPKQSMSKAQKARRMSCRAEKGVF